MRRIGCADTGLSGLSGQRIARRCTPTFSEPLIRHVGEYRGNVLRGFFKVPPEAIVGEVKIISFDQDRMNAYVKIAPDVMKSSGQPY